MFVERYSLFVFVGMLLGFVIAGGPVGAQEESFESGLSYGGHIHAIATDQSQDFQAGGSGDTSALDVNSVELGVTASPHKRVDATVVWLLEEGFNSGGPNDGFAVDQAFVTVAGNNRVLAAAEGRKNYDDSPYYLQAGKFYIPFGTNLEYHTFDVISEPQSLGLSETLETSLMVGYTPAGPVDLYGGLYGGSGPDRSSSDATETLDDGYLGAEVRSGSGELALQWTNNISNSIALGVENGGEVNGNPGAVGGVAAYGSYEIEPLRLQVEYVSALDEYDAGSSNFNGNKPYAVSSELTVGSVGAWDGKPVDFTLVYGQTGEWIDHPETTAGAVVDVGLTDGVTGSAEVLSRDYDTTLTGRLDEETLVSVRLATDFSFFLSHDT